jgi:hypothetical protein
MKTMSSSKVWILFLLLLAAGLLSACSRVLPAASAQSIDVSIVNGDGGSRTNDGLDEAADVIAEGQLLPRDTVWLAFWQQGLGSAGRRPASLHKVTCWRLNGRERVGAQLAAAKLERLNAQQALDDLIENALDEQHGAPEANRSRKMAIDARQMLDDLTR